MLCIECLLQAFLQYTLHTCLTRRASGFCTPSLQKIHQSVLIPVLAHTAGVFPFRTHLTANRLKRGYVEVTVEETCSLFDGGQAARGFVCHTAEILQERIVGGLPAVGSGRRNSLSSRDEGWQAGYSALMQTPGAKPVQEVSPPRCTMSPSLCALVQQRASGCKRCTCAMQS